VATILHVIFLLLCILGPWSRSSTHPEKYASILKSNNSSKLLAGGACCNAFFLLVAEDACKWTAEAQISILQVAGGRGGPYVSKQHVCTPQVAKAKSKVKAPDNISSTKIHMRKPIFCGLQVLDPQGPRPPKSNMSFVPFEDNMFLKLYIFTGSDSFEAFWSARFESTISLTLTDFSFNSQIWEEKKPSVQPSFFQKHGGSLTTRGCSSEQEAPPWTRGIYTSTCVSFCSRWADPKKSHRAPSQRPSHDLSRFSVVNRSAVDNRSNGQVNSGGAVHGGPNPSPSRPPSAYSPN
jgi:hypothetical protein